MKVIEIKNIKRKEIPIYYRRIYSAVAVCVFLDKPMEVPLEFQIEHMPTGQTEIQINSMENVDYPLIPLHKEIKRIIAELDAACKLPN